MPPPSAPSPPPARPSRGLVGGLAAGVVAVAVAGYAVTGSPRLAQGPVPVAGAPADPASAAAARAAGMAQIASMVDGLAERLRSRPDDAQGWFMLARAYTLLGRYAESLPAWAKAAELDPNNAALVADWADATAAARSNVTHPDAVALVERALRIDPEQPKALAIAGTMAFERGRYDEAERRWQQLADRLPPGSDLRRQVEGGIADARARAGGAATPPGTAAPGVGPSAPSDASPPSASATRPPSAAPPFASVGRPPSAAAGPEPSARPSAGAAAAAIAGTVTLAPALAASVEPGDTVFVFARAASGPRMPLAVRRATVAELPFAYTLDDSMAMTPQATLSRADRVVVGARISKSGNAIARPGDLEGESEPVRPGASGVAIRIDRVVR